MGRASTVSDGDVAYASQYNTLVNDYAVREQVPVSYMIFKQDSTYYADHCLGTGTDYSDTDASTLIQRAWDNLPTNAALHLKNGDYDLTARLDFTNQTKRTIKGESMEGTKLSTSAALTKMIDISDSTRLVLEDLWLHGGDAAIHGIGVDAGHSANLVWINRVHLQNFEGWGLHSGGGSGQWITNSKFTSIDTSSYGGINCDGGVWYISKCSFAYNYYGVAIFTGTKASITDSNFGSNTQHGIYATSFGKLRVFGNRVEDSGSHGIWVADDHFIISGNHVFENDGTGIRLNGAEKGIISGNEVWNNDVNDINRHGIRLHDAKYIVVVANKAYDDQGVSATQNWGISETGTADENLISGNHLYGNTAGQLDPLGHNSLIRNNHGYNPIGVIANPFDTTNDYIELKGDAAGPAASTDYTIKMADAILSSTDSGNSDNAILIKDPSGTQINPSTLSTLDAYFIPIGYQVNWGAYTGAAPTVVASFN